MSNATLEEQDELLEEPLEGNDDDDDDEPEWCLETPLTASQHGELSNNDISQISITKRKKNWKKVQKLNNSQEKDEVMNDNSSLLITFFHLFLLFDYFGLQA